jgi:CRISPR system Cascade subunit CasC
MKNQIGIHILTAYPPSSPNRDELGQPKTAVVGGKTRQRISSQCIKRTWRLSKPVHDLDAPLSVRTRGLGSEVAKILREQGIDEKVARDRAVKIAEVFGKVEKKRAPDHAEMVVYGNEEWTAAMTLAGKIAAEKRDPSEPELKALPQTTTSLDCALFGRMRAAQPGLNVSAEFYSIWQRASKPRTF